MKANSTKPWVDIMKFFFAINIVLLHYGIFALFPHSEIIIGIGARMAVPYFFVASGFFWANKIIQTNEHIEKKRITAVYCKRLATKLLVFEPICVILWIGNRFLDKMQPTDILLSTIQDIFFYPRGALWYIQAVIIATLLLAPFVFSKKEIYAIIPAALLYVFATFGTRYHFLVQGTVWERIYAQYGQIFISVRNGLFEGFPFMLFGCLIARYQKQLLVPGKKQTLRFAILLALSYVICVIEAILLSPYPGNDGNAFHFAYILVVPLLFILSAQAPMIHHRNTKTLRNLSTSIYLLHNLFRPVFVIAVSRLLHTDSDWIVLGVGVFFLIVVIVPTYKKKIQPLYNWLT